MRMNDQSGGEQKLKVLETTILSTPSQYSKFPNLHFIIDCTDLLVERASSFTAQHLTYSSYKQNTTVKFLVGTIPSGSVCFVSEG